MQPYVYLSTLHLGGDLYFKFKTPHVITINYTVSACYDEENVKHFQAKTDNNIKVMYYCQQVCYSAECWNISVLSQFEHKPLNISQTAEHFTMSYDASLYLLRLTVCEESHGYFIENPQNCDVYFHQRKIARSQRAYFFELLTLSDYNVVYKENVTERTFELSEPDRSNFSAIGYPYAYHGLQTLALPEYKFSVRVATQDDLQAAKSPGEQLMVSRPATAALTRNQILIPDTETSHAHYSSTHVTIMNSNTEAEQIISRDNTYVFINGHDITQRVTPVCDAVVKKQTGQTTIEHRIENGVVSEELAGEFGLIPSCIQRNPEDQRKPRQISFFKLSATARPVINWQVGTEIGAFALVEIAILVAGLYSLRPGRRPKQQQITSPQTQQNDKIQVAQIWYAGEMSQRVNEVAASVGAM